MTDSDEENSLIINHNQRHNQQRNQRRNQRYNQRHTRIKCLNVNNIFRMLHIFIFLALIVLIVENSIIINKSKNLVNSAFIQNISPLIKNANHTEIMTYAHKLKLIIDMACDQGYVNC